jgi:two-component system response regulator HydG
MLEEADGGTLYLDAVDLLPPELGERLATLMASGVYWPAGATEGRTVDVRVVCAMDRDDAECSDALPHPDLAERLCSRAVRVPPLRERPEDIRLMAAHLLGEAGARSGHEAVLTDAAMAALVRHDFPGNLLELENVIEHAVLAADQPEIDAEHLPITQRGVEPQPMIGPHLNGAWPSIAAQARDAERYLLDRARHERPDLDAAGIAELLGTTARVVELRLQEYEWEE